MKDHADRIAEILASAESEIQRIIVEAAQAGDYRGVDMARTAAVSVRNLRAQISNPTGKAEAKAANGGARPKRKGAKRKTLKTGYPKFHVVKDTLIRIGWSKKQCTEYTHKTPRSVFDTTIKTMSGLANSGAGPFTAEQMIDKNNDSGTEMVPSYQVYAVIAFLRHANCIHQKGREGYEIPVDIVKAAQEAWRRSTHGLKN